MIEHVRRRAILANIFSDVYVATCDEEISEIVENNGGKIINTSNKHINGTSRAAEAVRDLDCTHIILLQGDEPLILPNQLKIINDTIINEPNCDAWNATGIIENKEDLYKNSFVKCLISQDGYIYDFFRNYSKIEDAKNNSLIIRKVLGIIAYKKEILQKIVNTDLSSKEKIELIEQIRIVDNNFKLKSISITPTLPSVNEPEEVEIVNEYISKNEEQKKLIKLIQNWQK